MQETLHKTGRRLMFMGFWWVGVVGNNYRMDSPRVSRDLVSLISQYTKGGGPTNVTCLFTTPNKNPGPFPSEPPQKVSATIPFSETGFRKPFKKINQTLFKT